MLRVKASKLTGTPGASGWSQVHEFLPEDPEKIKARGHLFAVVSTNKFEEGVEGVAAGREFLTRLHEEYFGDLSAKPFNALKNASEKVIREPWPASPVKEFGDSFGQTQISGAALVEGVVNCVAAGGGSVMISRDGILATILASSSSEVAAASGYPKRGDMMIIGTKRFFTKVPFGVIKAALQTGEPESAVETFAPMVHGDEETGAMGAVVIKFEEGGEAEFLPPSTPQDIEENPRAPLKDKLPGIFSTITRRIVKLLPRKEIYIRNSSSFGTDLPAKKSTLSVGIILLVILGVSIGFGIIQKNIKDAKGKYEGDLIAAQQELDEAVGLATVSPDRSRELFISSEEKLRKIEELKVKDSRISELRTKIQEQRGLILGEYSVNPDPFLDLTLLSSGFKGDELSLSEGNLFVLDKGSKKIVSIEVATKKSKVVAGPDKINEVSALASYSDRVFFLDSEGIKEIDGDVKTTISKEWGGEVLIHAYTGNIYVLDKGGGKIYRYSGGSDNSFGSKQSWLSDTTKPDFGSAKSWTIDGAVYVLIPPSRVLKFSQGSPQSFPISGIYPEVKQIDAIYSGDETKYFYLLDRSGKRVVVLDKSGKYKAQYVSDKISDAVGLIVSEEEKEIILLTGDKLYSLEVKHL